MPTTPLHFTLADLEQWVEKGLITPEQLTNIRSHIEAAGPVAEQAKAGPEQRKGLNFVSLAYYFGGFMILLAYTIFMGLQWESLEFTGQIAISLFTIVVLWAIGYFLQRSGFRIAGGLLIFAGTGIVPLFVFTVQRALGIWPDDQTYAYMEFYRIVAQTWILLELISIGVAVIVIWRVRFTLISLLIAFWTWFLSMDITRWVSQSDYWTWFGSRADCKHNDRRGNVRTWSLAPTQDKAGLQFLVLSLWTHHRPEPSIRSDIESRRFSRHRLSGRLYIIRCCQRMASTPRVSGVRRYWLLQLPELPGFPGFSRGVGVCLRAWRYRSPDRSDGGGIPEISSFLVGKSVSALSSGGRAVKCSC